MQRERDQIAGSAEAEIAEVRNTDPTALDYALAVRQVGPDNVQTATASSTATAAGASDDLDGTQITSSKTGKLMQLIVASSVAFKAELQTVTNAVATSTLLTIFGEAGKTVDLTFNKEAFTVAQDGGAGLDAFRIVFTNLDTSEAADGYVTFIYDEV